MKTKGNGRKKIYESPFTANQNHVLTRSPEVYHSSSQHPVTHRGLQCSLKTLTDEAFV